MNQSTMEARPHAHPRAVIYARYSSDLQREASIVDQVRLCQERAARDQLDVIEVYSDHAISGSSMHNRPGFLALMEAARRGVFDIVLAEALDRISRDQEDIAAIHKRLAHAGITLITLAEGEINELHVGLKGTMNALFLKDLASKTKRGLEGRIQEGRSGGGLCYGYDLVPGDIGARAINDAEASVIRHIFEEFAAGRSPRAIARTLNNEHVPGPHGRQWRDTAIRGHVIRGTGILNNELYIGRLVWNRLTYLKDPETGRRRSRMNPPDQWIVQQVPDLRIVGDDLWQRVKAVQQRIRASDAVTKARAQEFWKKRRARHLLTGLVHCGSCDGPYAASGKDYLVCSAARGRGTCSNRRSIRRGELEKIVLHQLQHRLMAPDLVEEFIRSFHEEVNRQRNEAQAARAGLERELLSLMRKTDSLVTAIMEGLRSPSLQERLDELEARKAALTTELAAPPPSPVRLHPGLATLYRQKVAQLHETLHDSSLRDQAIAILRDLIERVVIHVRGDGFEIELVGEIVRMVELGLAANNKKAALDGSAACSIKVVAGRGFEPLTFRL